MPSPPPDSYLSYFTPGQMSHETLEFIFVRRHKLAERLLNRIANSILTEAKQHTLLLGPRGMGKSYMVALMYHRVKAREDLKGKIAIAWLAEEEWGVGNLRDFYLVILRALSQEYPESGLTAELTRLRTLPPREIEEAVAQSIRDFVGDRTLLLLVENLEEIFRGLGPQGQWAFRSFLSEKPFVTILATTQSLFAAIQKQSEAFYGFFQQTYLDELTAAEATELLEKVAERRGDTDLAEFLKTPVALERVQAVNDLAGGHPRIYLLFAHLLTPDNLDELVTPFLQLLDELTPYYQSRMLTLAPQQRKVVEYLCDRRGAIQVKIIAQDNLFSPQATAAHLNELEKLGYVRKIPVGRESYYELREPLLRMVIELKRSHNTEPIRLIVDFLRRWYSRHERLEWLSRASDNSPLTRQYLECALDLNLATLDGPDIKWATVLEPELLKCLQQEDFSSAEVVAAEIIERKGINVCEDDWLTYVICLIRNRNIKQGIDLYQLIYERYRNEYVNGNSELWNSLSLLMIFFLISMKMYAEAIFAASLMVSYWENSNDSNSELVSSCYSMRGFVRLIMDDFPGAISDLNVSISKNHNNKQAYLLKAEAYLNTEEWEMFFDSLQAGMEIPIIDDSIAKISQKYCEIILIKYSPAWMARLNCLVGLYHKYNLLVDLLQGIIASIPTLLREDVPVQQANAWLMDWQKRGTGEPEFTLTMRLLEAAVAWKSEPDERILLTLPLEERQVLEKLLPGSLSQSS